MAKVAAEVAEHLSGLREICDVEDEAALYRSAGDPPPLPGVQPGDPAQIQYTSGTTGFPKGVVLSHRALANNSRHYYAVAELPDEAVTIAFTPLFHTTGCSIAVLGAIQIGSPMVLLRQFDPDAALDLIEAERVEMFLGVPTMLIAMCAAQQARPRDLSSVRSIAVGGAMVAPELVREVVSLFGARFLTAYGQTECSPLITMNRPGDGIEDVAETIGQPMPCTDVGIFALDGDAVLPCGAVGEIRARSYALMNGYNDDPEATAKAIDAEGWLHTGDLGTMDERGFVRITGRLKEMIIRGGENLFPAEIENVLLEHPDVADAAVVGVPDALLGEAVAAFVRLAPGAALDPAALKTHCRARMAAQKTPRLLGRGRGLADDRVRQGPEVRAPRNLGARSQPGAVVRRRVGRFLGGRVHARQLVQQAARGQRGDEQDHRRDSGDDRGQPGQRNEIDQRDQQDRDDDPEQPVP